MSLEKILLFRYSLTIFKDNAEGCSDDVTASEMVQCMRAVADDIMRNKSLPCLLRPFSEFSLELPACNASDYSMEVSA